MKKWNKSSFTNKLIGIGHVFKQNKIVRNAGEDDLRSSTLVKFYFAIHYEFNDQI
jgi:hypothetical protein